MRAATRQLKADIVAGKVRRDIFTDSEWLQIKGGRERIGEYTWHHLDNIQSGEEPDLPIEYRFEDGLIPFGENGGGDMICFDYRNDKTTDNPPIVIWNHDMGLKHRVVFIANNFDEFINMLHEPED